MDVRLTQQLEALSDKELVERAYLYAFEAHRGQLRKSGEPYFNHLVESALLATAWKADATTIAATLLHDSVEDTAITIQEIKREFGSSIATLVTAVTKAPEKGETLRRLVRGISQDPRVAVVKLADRIHNMGTLEHLRPEKAERIARETIQIYLPLAYGLGLSQAARQLERLCLPYGPVAHKHEDSTLLPRLLQLDAKYKNSEEFLLAAVSEFELMP